MGQFQLSARETRVINAMRANTGRPAVTQGTISKAVTATPAEVKPRYFTKAEIDAGLGHPCILGCTKRTRSLERSLRHATNQAELQEFGHYEV